MNKLYTILFSLLGVFLVGGVANASLWQVFGGNLPPLNQRGAEQCGISNYTGTAEQNIQLEACLSNLVLGAPTQVYQRTILPEANNTYDLGSATRTWRSIYGNFNSSTSTAAQTLTSGVNVTTTVFVDAMLGTDNTSCGSALLPCQTTQKALNIYNASLLSGALQVVHATGTYNFGSISLPKIAQSVTGTLTTQSATASNVRARLSFTCTNPLVTSSVQIVGGAGTGEAVINGEHTGYQLEVDSCITLSSLSASNVAYTLNQQDLYLEPGFNYNVGGLINCQRNSTIQVGTTGMTNVTSTLTSSSTAVVGITLGTGCRMEVNRDIDMRQLRGTGVSIAGGGSILIGSGAGTSMRIAGALGANITGILMSNSGIFQWQSTGTGDALILDNIAGSTASPFLGCSIFGQTGGSFVESTAVTFHFNSTTFPFCFRDNASFYELSSEDTVAVLTNATTSVLLEDEAIWSPMVGSFANLVVKQGAGRTASTTLGTDFRYGRLQSSSTNQWASVNSFATATYFTSLAPNGGLTFVTSSGLLSTTSALYWDNVSGRLGIGTNIPSTTAHIFSSVPTLRIQDSVNTGANTYIPRIDFVTASNVIRARIDLNTTQAGDLTVSNFSGAPNGNIKLNTASVNRLAVSSVGLIGLNSSTPNALLSMTSLPGNPIIDIRSSTLASTTLLRVDERGYFGFGTTTPGAPIDVALYTNEVPFTPNLKFSNSSLGGSGRVSTIILSSGATSNRGAKLSVAETVNGASSGLSDQDWTLFLNEQRFSNSRAGDPMTWYVGGSEIARINSTGSGFRTSSPVATLSVTSQTNQDALKITTSTGSDLLVVRNNGNVGIGTHAPLGKLVVGPGSLTDTNLDVQINAESGSEANYAVNKAGSYGFLFGYKNSNEFANIGPLGYLRVVPNDPFTIWVANNQISTMWNSNNDVALGGHITSSSTYTGAAMVVKGGGSQNVGVGTTTPIYKLGVTATTSNNGLAFGVHDSQNNPLFQAISSTVNVMDFDTFGVSPISGLAAVAKVGAQNKKAGVVQIENNGLIYFTSETGTTTGQIEPRGAIFTNDGGGTTSTFRYDGMKTGMTTANKDGTFSINNVGAVSASSTIRAFDDVYVRNIAKGVVLTSPGGTCYRVTVSDLGVLTTASITCP